MLTRDYPNWCVASGAKVSHTARLRSRKCTVICIVMVSVCGDTAHMIFVQRAAIHVHVLLTFSNIMRPKKKKSGFHVNQRFSSLLR